MIKVSLLAILSAALLIVAIGAFYGKPDAEPTVKPMTPEQVQEFFKTHQPTPAQKKAADKKTAVEKKAAEDAQQYLDKELRKYYAKDLQHRMWHNGVECTVAVRGKNFDILTTHYALAGQAFAYQFGEKVLGDDEIATELRKLGFKRVQLENAYEEVWTWKLE